MRTTQKLSIIFLILLIMSFYGCQFSRNPLEAKLTKDGWLTLSFGFATVIKFEDDGTWYATQYNSSYTIEEEKNGTWSIDNNILKMHFDNGSFYTDDKDDIRLSFLKNASDDDVVKGFKNENIDYKTKWYVSDNYLYFFESVFASIDINKFEEEISKQEIKQNNNSDDDYDNEDDEDDDEDDDYDDEDDDDDYDDEDYDYNED